MDELFEVVLRNPFLLLLLIGGLISVFRDKKPDQKQQRRTVEQKRAQQRQQEQRRQSSPSTAETTTEKHPAETIFDMFFEDATEEPKKVEEPREQISVDDQRDEQLERLQAELGAQEVAYDPQSMDHQRSELSQTKAPKTSEKSPIRKNKLRNNIEKRLTREGLVESVIMAEVLGRPRSKRSHHRHL